MSRLKRLIAGAIALPTGGDSMFHRLVLFPLAILTLSSLAGLAQDTAQSEREVMYRRYLQFDSYVKGGSVEPHWMADSSSFWYAEGLSDSTVIYVVDPAANTRTELFDVERLRRALASRLGHEPPHTGLPFRDFAFTDQREQAVRFRLEDRDFVLELNTYAVEPVAAPAREEAGMHPARPREVLSPDGRWAVWAYFRGNYNLWLRSTTERDSTALTTDGIEDYQWTVNQPDWWSPTSEQFVAVRVDLRSAEKWPLVRWLQPTVDVEWVPDWLAARYDFFFVSIPGNHQLQVRTGGEPGDRHFIVGWRPDGSELLFLRMRRDFKRLDLVAASPQDGDARVVVTETEETFIKGIARDPHWSESCWLLDDGRRFLWMSERDGWNHLYLYDLNGDLLRQLTSEAFAVMQIVSVDEKLGWVYFTAQGVEGRPYDIHLYRVNLRGDGFARLTESIGAHDIQFSPSMQFFIDTHSSVVRPLSSELRQADGTLLQTLSVANTDRLNELAWAPPEEFVVKADDGVTDLYGVLFKPYDFDPAKKYPVVELIYAGPQGLVNPRSFIPHDMVPFQALAQLGFVVFGVDGRGTPGRGKVFQDAVYGNFGRREIPEHVAVLKQLGEQRHYMDLTRVGIWGWSWGGYFAVRALLTAPDVYHVGVAFAAGNGDYGFPNDIYLGPLRDSTEFEYASNLRLADNLEGKLLFIYGTSDRNVTFSQGMRMVDALIQAGRPFDLLVFPERDHGLPNQRESASAYFWEATRRYFEEHLKP